MLFSLVLSNRSRVEIRNKQHDKSNLPSWHFSCDLLKFLLRRIFFWRNRRVWLEAHKGWLLSAWRQENGNENKNVLTKVCMFAQTCCSVFLQVWANISKSHYTTKCPSFLSDIWLDTHTAVCWIVIPHSDIA